MSMPRSSTEPHRPLVRFVSQVMVVNSARSPVFKAQSVAHIYHTCPAASGAPTIQPFRLVVILAGGP